MGTDDCALCGLPLRYDHHFVIYDGQTQRFCCAGCKMVFMMLSEAADAPAPSQFKQTDLYRRCVAAGVVPAGEQDLSNFPPDPQGTKAEVDSEETFAFELEKHFRLEGMWCPACAWVIRAVLEKMDGVLEARCNFVTDRLYCRYDPVRTSPKQMADVVDQLGYAVFEPEDHLNARSKRSNSIKLMVSGVLSANIMMLSWALYSGFFTKLNYQGVVYIGWPAAVMAAIVLGYGGGSVLRRAWSGIRHGAPGMEALVGLGAVSAYVYSLASLIQGSLQLYFDTAAMLITLLLLGKMLEGRAKNKVRQDLDGFLSLQPHKVRVCSPDHPEGRFLAIDQLQVGDVFRVSADEIVPADGRVARGEATINAAAITGEPRSKVVGPGGTVFSGCLLLEGSLYIETVRTGRQTMLGQMVAIVQQSLAGKTVLENRTDRLLAVFVPFIAGLAALTGITAYAMGTEPDLSVVRAVTVLVIACPCALGIAIPLARVAGLAGAARQGLLIREFEFFERSSDMDTVVFDKTGTLTHGNWRLEGIETFEDRPVEDIVALVCGLEGENKHAVARSVGEYARSRGIDPAIVSRRESVPEGVGGWFQGQQVRVGTWRYVMGNVGEGAVVADPAAKMESTLLSKVFVGAAGRLWAVLKFGDAMRPGMPTLINWLRENLGEIHLISGDSREATKRAATQLGITGWRGGLYPKDKADYIKALQAQGDHVLMVGDGVNDAPALAQADLSVAVYSGAPLAREAAQVTLMRGNPTQLAELLVWSRQVDQKIRQNIWCAFIYNLVSLPIAMSGWLNPLVAVTAMLLSSLTVIGNTLFLLRRKPMMKKRNVFQTER